VPITDVDFVVLQRNNFKALKTDTRATELHILGMFPNLASPQTQCKHVRLRFKQQRLT
jgi:hypothetical protein